jgi:hypothetical protein
VDFAVLTEDLASAADPQSSTPEFAAVLFPCGVVDFVVLTDDQASAADPQSSVAGIPAVELLATVVTGGAADELLEIPQSSNTG